jgi:hypothetical protein
MAAQALCEHAKGDATKSNANFKTGFGRLFKDRCPQISGTCAAKLLALIGIFGYGIFGILILIIQHLFQISLMHIYY